MDIVYTGTDLVRVPILLECFKKLHVALGCLDRNDISIKALNRGEDVVKVGITEV